MIHLKFFIKRQQIVANSILLLLPCLLFAQRVEKQTHNGKEYFVVIADGLPANAVKTVYEVQNQTIDPSTGITFRHTLLSGNGSNPHVNARVSPRFAVAPSNLVMYTEGWMGASGWWNDQSDSNPVGSVFKNLNPSGQVAAPLTGCRAYRGPYNYDSEQGKWRLPTQRELLLMSVLQSNLSNLSGFTKMLHLHWSSTEYNVLSTYGSAYAFSFTLSAKGDGRFWLKHSGTIEVRCVRDLDYGGGMP